MRRDIGTYRQVSLRSAIGVLLLMFVVCVIASCSGDETLDSRDIRDRELTFRILSEKTVSKATTTTIATLENFRVSAYWRESPGVGFTPNFMYNISVIKNSSDNWIYSPIKYYPPSGGVDFYAYSPYNSMSATNFAESAATPELKYVVPPAASLQEDFLIAKAVATHDGSTWTNPWGTIPNPVNMEFKHALSQVVFDARSTAKGVKFIIKEITITNLKPSGAIDLSTQTWGAPAGTDTHYPVDIASPVVFDFAPGTGTLPEFEAITDDAAGTAMMVLPQTVTPGTAGVKTSEPGKSHITITYAAISWNNTPLYGAFDEDADYGDAVPEVTEYVTDYISLAIGAFEMGKRYRFQLNLGTGLIPVSFDVGVTTWPNPAVIIRL